ncbi:MAG: VWA domain-containing protein, partial [Phycisphaerales bacterium JB038]
SSDLVDVPPSAPAGAPITMRVTLLSTEATSGLLQVTADGRVLDLNGAGSGTGRPLELKPGKNVELVTIPLDDRIIHRFEAYFQPLSDSADRLVGNNRGEAVTVSPGEGRVLIVENRDAPSGELLEGTLRRLNIEVERLHSGQLPYDLLSYQAYNLVLLNNVPAEQVPPPLQELLAAYVTQLGGGLVMIGGPDSFGAGGWNDTPLEAILPVRLDLPEQLIVPSAAVAFVLDSSGSMSHQVFGSADSQQTIANEGAALAIQTLDRQDLVTVIAFDNAPRVVAPLAPNRDPEATMDLVRSIAPGGGTNLYPALYQAYSSLRRAEAQIKHVIVLSDGRSMPGPFTELAAQMLDEDITVSTIAVGDEADDAVLEAISLAGGGQFYRVYQPQTLPRIFVREVRIVRKPLVREGRFDPIVLPSGSPLTLNLSAAPPLGGLVLTQPREEETITLAAVDAEGTPVLAHWNVELGRVAAFTSSADASWSQAWIDSPAYEELWGAMARVIARPAASQDSELTAQFEGDVLRLRLDAADREGNPLDLLSVPGSVYTPAGERLEISLAQSGPGAYEALVPAKEAGNYVVALAPRKGSTPLPPIVAGAGRSTGPEYASLEADLSLLQRAAESTGGRLLDLERPAEAGLYADELRRPVQAREPIWLTLAWWCLPLLLLDVATRRIAWDRYVSKAAAVEFARQAAESVRSRGEEAASTLGALRSRSQAAETEDSGADSPPKLVGDGGRMKPVRLRREELLQNAPAKPSADEVQAALQGMGLRPDGRDAGDEEAEPAAEADSPATPTTSGLLAAKKRARQRLQDPDPGAEAEDA